jgi:hypothetical protein
MDGWMGICGYCGFLARLMGRGWRAFAFASSYSRPLIADLELEHLADFSFPLPSWAFLRLHLLASSLSFAL